MFTGIIETLGRVEKLVKEQSNLHVTITTPLAKELKVDQSVSHNGVCLTVVEQNEDSYTVTANEETLNKTNLGTWSEGDWRSARWPHCSRPCGVDGALHGYCRSGWKLVFYL